MMSRGVQHIRVPLKQPQLVKQPQLALIVANSLEHNLKLLSGLEYQAIICSLVSNARLPTLHANL